MSLYEFKALIYDIVGEYNKKRDDLKATALDVVLLSQMIKIILPNKLYTVDEKMYFCSKLERIYPKEECTQIMSRLFDLDETIRKYKNENLDCKDIIEKKKKKANIIKAKISLQ